MKLIHEFVDAVGNVHRLAAGLNIINHLIISPCGAGGELNGWFFEKVDRKFVFSELMKIETDSLLQRGETELRRCGCSLISKGFINRNLEDCLGHIL